MKIKELDIVALKEDIPGLALKAGDNATVVHIYSDGELVLEFVAEDGYTIGLLDIDPSGVREATPAELERQLPSRPGEPFMERLVDGKLTIHSKAAS
jgi:hypothetical protein